MSFAALTCDELSQLTTNTLKSLDALHKLLGGVTEESTDHQFYEIAISCRQHQIRAIIREQQRREADAVPPPGAFLVGLMPEASDEQSTLVGGLCSLLLAGFSVAAIVLLSIRAGYHDIASAADHVTKAPFEEGFIRDKAIGVFKRVGLGR